MLPIFLHLLLLIAFPPLLVGVINRTKAFFGGRQGPPVLQPYYDLWRLFQKGTVQSTTTRPRARRDCGGDDGIGTSRV